MYTQNREPGHQQQTQTVSELRGLAPGTLGIRQTLKLMKQLALEGRKKDNVRELSLDLIKDLPQKSYVDEIRRIFEFVQSQIRYVRDPDGLETIHDTDAILKLRQGDCDDKCILLAAMLKSIGVKPVRFVALAFNKPYHYEHVLVQTKIGENWVSLECTEPKPFGWTPPGS